MPYIGKEPVAGNFVLLDSITTSATATYALTKDSVAYSPESARNMIVSLNGVTQAPETAFTVSGSNITFSSALTSSDVIDYILVLGDVLSVGTPSDGTVGTSQMSYPLGNFSSTGIDDNATSTAITIDSSQNVGVGTASPDTPLEVSVAGSGATDVLKLTTTATNSIPAILFEGDGLGTQHNIARIRAQVDDASNGGLVFETESSGTIAERMRIDAGGSVLIGKTTPTDLHNTWNHLIIGEKGAIISENGAGGIDGITISDNAYIDADTGSYAYQTTAAASKITQSGGVTTFSNAASGTAGTALTLTERMRIDSSGNVGIGLTPSAWSTGKAVELGFQGNALWGNAADEVIVSQNAYYNSGWKYATTRAATHYSQYNAAHRWFTAPSGTANSAITWTQAMTLDSSGRLGIGTTSPSSMLHLYGTDPILKFQDSAGGDTFGAYVSNTDGFGIYNFTDSRQELTIAGNAKSGVLTTSPQAEWVVSNVANERNIEMGYSAGSAANYIQAYDRTASAFYDLEMYANNLMFHTGSSGLEHMRIDSSGSVLFGKTTSTLSTSGGMIIAGNSITMTIASGTTYHLHDGSNYKFYVNANGGIYNYSGNNVNLSDQRAKKDIVDSGNYLEKLCNIPVRNFRYNEDAEDGKHHLGVIAQEVEAVAPEFVNKASWEHKDGQMDTVYNTDLMFAMMKSIQELSAQVNELKAEVAALKGA